MKRTRRKKKINLPESTGPINLGLTGLLDASDSKPAEPSPRATPLGTAALRPPEIVIPLFTPGPERAPPTGASEIQVEASVLETPAETHTVLETPLAAPAVSSLPECEALAATGEWKQLLARAEGMLHGEEEIETRLWWVRSNVHLGILPNAFLIARLESLLTQLHAGQYRSRSDPSYLSTLTKSTLGDLATRLDQKGEAALAKIMTDKGAAVQVAPSASKIRVAELLGRAAIKPNPQNPPTGSVSRESRVFARAASPAIAAPKAQPSVADAPRPRRRFLYAGAAAGVAALIAAVTLMHGGTPEGAEGALSFTAEALQAGSASPKSAPLELGVPAIDPVGDVNQLATLVYDMDSAAPAPVHPVAVHQESAPARIEQSAPPREPAVPRLPVVKEKIVIDKATEPDAVRRYETVPEEPKDEENEIDFPPFRNNHHTGGRSSSDRVVEKFPAPRALTVIAPTRVMERPSYWAEVRGALDIGDEVQAEARVGVWYRIRMRHGDEAYILAQDVQE